MAKAPKFTELKLMQDESRENEVVCASCGIKRWCNVDHIVPMFMIDQLGLKLESYSHKWNLQFLCRACHSRKNARLDFTNPLTIPNLRRYIEMAADYYSH